MLGNALLTYPHGSRKVGGYPTCAIQTCLIPLTAASTNEIDNNQCLCTNSTLDTQNAAYIRANCASVSSDVYNTYFFYYQLVSGYSITLSSL